ncbi:MAG: hypothetical protein ABIP34_07170 [Rhodoferax sp.]|uniref:hypothetical protein n=1 Tax=Rhodoferax sp. TaxID=50421 RepID=UPI003264A632
MLWVKHADAAPPRGVVKWQIPGPKLTLPIRDKFVDKPGKPLYAWLKYLFLKGKACDA